MIELYLRNIQETPTSLLTPFLNKLGLDLESEEYILSKDEFLIFEGSEEEAHTFLSYTNDILEELSCVFGSDMLEDIEIN